MKKLTLFVLLFPIFCFAAKVTVDRDMILQRIVPVGKVHIEDVAAPIVSEVAGEPEREGKMVYDHACIACHASGAANAPILGDKVAWSPRIKKGVETLIKNVKSGFKVMPARGGCMDCSDEEIIAAVEFMLDAVK